MKNMIIALFVVLLLVLHQDYWQWNRNELMVEFLPYTLAYNIGISLATAAMWVFVCVFLWPKELDENGPLRSATTRSPNGTST